MFPAVFVFFLLNFWPHYPQFVSQFSAPKDPVYPVLGVIQPSPAPSRLPQPEPTPSPLPFHQAESTGQPEKVPAYNLAGDHPLKSLPVTAITHSPVIDFVTPSPSPSLSLSPSFKPTHIPKPDPLPSPFPSQKPTPNLTPVIPPLPIEPIPIEPPPIDECLRRPVDPRAERPDIILPCYHEL